MNASSFNLLVQNETRFYSYMSLRACRQQFESSQCYDEQLARVGFTGAGDFMLRLNVWKVFGTNKRVNDYPLADKFASAFYRKLSTIHQCINAYRLYSPGYYSRFWLLHGIRRHNKLYYFFSPETIAYQHLRLGSYHYIGRQVYCSDNVIIWSPFGPN